MRSVRREIIMPIQELYKLRRFALGAGLVLLSYSVAGIQLKTEALLFGFPFVICRPEFLPFGLIVASVYGLLRFYYYGLMLSQNSPYHHRKDLLSKLDSQNQTDRYKGSVYFGPSRLYTASAPQREQVEKQAERIIEAFPKFGDKRVSFMVNVNDASLYKVTSKREEPHVIYKAEISIPRTCRLMAFFQDIDYTLPIWLNILALLGACLLL